MSGQSKDEKKERVGISQLVEIAPKQARKLEEVFFLLVRVCVCVCVCVCDRKSVYERDRMWCVCV